MIVWLQMLTFLTCYLSFHAHLHYFIVDSFCKEVSAIHSNRDIKRVLTTLCQFYAIYGIDRNIGDFLQVGKSSLVPQGGGEHCNTFICCHPQVSDFRSNPKHGYPEFEIMTPYRRYSFTDLPQ